MRRAAYSRAKEYRKTDPPQIALMEKLRQQRRDAYQKAKEREKVLWSERPSAERGRCARTRGRRIRKQSRFSWSALRVRSATLTSGLFVPAVSNTGRGSGRLKIQTEPRAVRTIVQVYRPLFAAQNISMKHMRSRS